jgi:hypothetical protein
MQNSAVASCQVVAASFSSGVVYGGILCKLVELTMKACSFAFYFIFLLEVLSQDIQVRCAGVCCPPYPGRRKLQIYIYFVAFVKRS